MKTPMALSFILGSALALAPAIVAAQSGSSLFSVGEGARSKSGASSSPKPASVAKSPGSSPATAKPAAAKPTAAKVNAAKSSSKRRVVARQAPPAVALNGRWHDGECIPLTGITRAPALFVKRVYDFDDRRKSWRLEASVYPSEACAASTRLLVYRGEGGFAVTGQSRVAANAYDASFRIERWQATPVNRDGVLTLLNGRCGSGDFEEGRALDLSRTGCDALGIRPIAQRPREFELVRVAAGKFYLGSRSFIPGLPDERPTQLSSYGMIRVSQ